MRIPARGTSTAKTSFGRLMHMCRSLGGAYGLLHAKYALAPKPKSKGSKLGLNPVPKQEKVEGKAAPELVAIE